MKLLINVTEKYDLAFDDHGSSADRSSINLVTIRDHHESEDIGDTGNDGT